MNTTTVEEHRKLDAGSPRDAKAFNRKPTRTFAEFQLYEAMGAAVQSSIEAFLRAFESTVDSTYALNSMTREEFFPQFLSTANALADQCGQQLVKILHTNSFVPTVREMRAADLAKRIRESGFRSLDITLFQCAELAKKIEVIKSNIRKIRDALCEGAPTDSQAAGEADTGNEWATEQELGRQHELLLRVESQAHARIVEYLKAIEALPATVLSYGCDKCFGGEVDYGLEGEEVTRINGAIQNKLTQALGTLARAGHLAQKELGGEKADILNNIQQQKVLLVLNEMAEAKMEKKLHAKERLKRFVPAVLVSILILTAAGFWLVVHSF